jgi:putative cell wall-binding protein
MNNIKKLRSIIRESIQDYIKEIDSAGTTAMYEAKMKACDEAIEKRMKKIEMAESLEEMQGMFDESKMKDLKTEIKALEKQKAKYGKMLEKLNKGKEVVTEEPVEEEAPVDEADITAEMTDDTMTEGHSGSHSYNDVLKLAQKTSDLSSDKGEYVNDFKKKFKGKSQISRSEWISWNNNWIDDMADMKYVRDNWNSISKMTESPINESFLKMQKLAGIIK